MTGMNNLGRTLTGNNARKPGVIRQSLMSACLHLTVCQQSSMLSHHTSTGYGPPYLRH